MRAISAYAPRRCAAMLILDILHILWARGLTLTPTLTLTLVAGSYLCYPDGAKNCRGQAPRALHSDDGMSGWTVLYNHFR